MDHNQAIQSQAVERYWLRELSRSEREEFEEHFFVCAQCTEALHIVEMLEENAKETLKQQSTGTKRWNPLSWIPMSVAAALLVGLTSYDRLVEIPEYQKQLSAYSAPAAVEPVVLHEVSRGESIASVFVSKSAPFYYLTLDVAEPSETGYDCVIQTAAGARVAELKQVRPLPGGELSLRLSAKTTPAGTYALVLSDTASRTETHRFLFKVDSNSK